jgi:DNA modification methylase
MNIENKDGVEFLKSLDDNSIDLIITDPPYLISKETGMNTFQKEVQKIDLSGENKKTPEQWELFKIKKGYTDDKYRNNYIKYGNTSGNKFAFKTDFGVWDKEFTIDKLKEFIQLFYKKLRKGGTCIIFFDIWKLETLKKLMETAKSAKNGFKQIRFIEWLKTNPIPLNQSVNYLSNCREVALLGVKGGKPTFNSKYDTGLYKYPIQNTKGKRHPTQKNLKLFEELIQKHSNEGDIVVDPFLGSGTTVIACKNTNRKFSGCEINETYYKMSLEELK